MPRRRFRSGGGNANEPWASRDGKVRSRLAGSGLSERGVTGIIENNDSSCSLISSVSSSPAPLKILIARFFASSLERDPFVSPRTIFSSRFKSPSVTLVRLTGDLVRRAKRVVTAFPTRFPSAIIFCNPSEKLPYAEMVAITDPAVAITMAITPSDPSSTRTSEPNSRVSGKNSRATCSTSSRLS